MDCPFCSIGPEQRLFEDSWVYAVFDRYPVIPGHMLMITKRHCEQYFSASQQEKQALWQALAWGRRYLDDLHGPHGYNIGLNCGMVAGQTILHCHMHLIPRFEGDMSDPRGGVRGVIPEKQKY